MNSHSAPDGIQGCQETMKGTSVDEEQQEALGCLWKSELEETKDLCIKHIVPHSLSA
jgi:hypothetical protein